LLNSRKVQLAKFVVQHLPPAICYDWRIIEVGIYTGRMLKCETRADLPVIQAVGFEFALNLQTEPILSIIMPAALLALGDEVTEQRFCNA
jgi:hypothetical protein